MVRPALSHPPGPSATQLWPGLPSSLQPRPLLPSRICTLLDWPRWLRALVPSGIHALSPCPNFEVFTSKAKHSDDHMAGTHFIITSRGKAQGIRK